MKESRQVAVLIIAHKPILSHLEKISLLQCFKVLHRHPIFFICPHGIDVTEYRKLLGNDIQVDFIDPQWQATYENFNRLKILPFLYRRYRQYEYLLFYEPDAFVFRDELEEWCNRGYDYIGAPWFEGFATKDENAPFVGVGNGGFSLRKTHAHLRALRTFSYVRPPQRLMQAVRRPGLSWGGRIKAGLNLLLNLTVRNNTFFLLNTFKGHEDLFWGKYVSDNFEWYQVAPLEEAAHFSFEALPQRLWKLTNHQTPFGCHAWWRYDLDFWKPLIEAEGYDLEPAIANDKTNK